MAKITIKRRNDYERADGSAQLYISFYLGKKNIRIPTGVHVTRKEWDPVKERVKGNEKSAADDNMILKSLCGRITDIMLKFRISNKKITCEDFFKAYNRPDSSETFLTFARKHLSEMNGVLEFETIRHHQAALKKLDEYRKGLLIDEITPEFLKGYMKYLRDIIGNSPGTINKNIGVIRTHFFAALREGLAKSNPFESIKIPKQESNATFLNEEEFVSLIKLYREGTLPNNEQNALRFFLFMSLTGMHITDARNLQIEQIFNEQIHYKRQKTRSNVSVPISDSAEVLIEYYRAGRRRGNLLQNLPTDQAFNRLIKRICARAGITKNISAKSARHTFATLYLKGNPEQVAQLSKLLGHTSVDTTMIYAHILKETKTAGISIFNGLLSK